MHLRRKYGLTVKDYARMLEEQGGTCKLCSKPPNGKALDVDHDHETGAVRGLLCSYCNRQLGHVEKDPVLFLKMMEYLK